MGGTPGISEPGGHSSARGTGCPSSVVFGKKSMAASPLKSPFVMCGSSDFRGRNLRSSRISTRTWPDSGSRSSELTSPMRTPDLRMGVPGPMPGASGNRREYLALFEKISGARPKNSTSAASTASDPATNAPNFSRFPRSAMTRLRLAASRSPTVRG